jgi:hypothetical protein
MPLMNRRLEVALALCVCVGLHSIGPTACRADLFTVDSPSGDILRIDSTTLAVTKTYANLSGPVGAALFTGLAFDGRVLTCTRNVNLSAQEVVQFDLLTEQWLPPIEVHNVLPPEVISGLGALRPEIGGGLLAITTTPGSINLPAMFYRIDPSGEALPLGELPVEYQALGLDVDPLTNEIWVAARHKVENRLDLLQISIPQLLSSSAIVADPLDEPQQVIVGPSLVKVLSPAFPRNSPPRGVGFDHGHMFVATILGPLYEVDRTTGELLRTLELSITGAVGGLTGGNVVPEPSAAMATAVAAVLLAPRKRRIRRSISGM